MTRREPALIGADLRTAMDVVVEGYLRFLQAGPEPATEDDTKAFAAHHAACRAALAHLSELVKLARQLGSDAPEVEEAATILREARAALAAFEEDRDGEEDPC